MADNISLAFLFLIYNLIYNPNYQRKNAWQQSHRNERGILDKTGAIILRQIVAMHATNQELVIYKYLIDSLWQQENVYFYRLIAFETYILLHSNFTITRELQQFVDS